MGYLFPRIVYQIPKSHQRFQIGFEPDARRKILVGINDAPKTVHPHFFPIDIIFRYPNPGIGLIGLDIHLETSPDLPTKTLRIGR